MIIKRLLLASLLLTVFVGACGDISASAGDGDENLTDSVSSPKEIQAAASSDHTNDPNIHTLIGEPFPEVRTALLRLGWERAAVSVDQPHRLHADLSCPNYSSVCRALFLRSGSDGWKHHWVVVVDPQILAVTEIRQAASAESPPSIPPSLAADMPALPQPYREARVTLMALGFRPVPAADPTTVCPGWMSGRDEWECTQGIRLIEAECGNAGCTALWRAPDGRRLNIILRGEPMPGAIYTMKWQPSE